MKIQNDSSWLRCAGIPVAAAIFNGCSMSLMFALRRAISKSTLRIFGKGMFNS